MTTRTIATLPPKAKLRELAYAVVWNLLGAVVYDYCGGADKRLQWGQHNEMYLSNQDWDTVQAATVVMVPGMKVQGESLLVVSPSLVLDLHRRATVVLEGFNDERVGRHGLLMLQDDTGSGWWRMMMPARHMDLRDDWWVDITSSTLRFEDVLEYDTIFVQRVHTWQEHYVLEKLKRAGKRIVYDLDDDIFHIPSSNPASRVLGKDEQFAAMACMKLADVVTVTTEPLRSMLEQEVGDKVEVIPNALDVDAGWRSLDQIGSPDGKRRIFWSGGATHAADWEICINAVRRVMVKYEDVVLVILGFLPPVIRQRVGTPPFSGRVEYMGYNDPDTYFELVKHVAADVGIAPLEETQFNQGKSEIKFLEYSLIGMPTVASDTGPYANVIKDGESGRLVGDDENEWYTVLCEVLDGSKDDRRDMVREARATVTEMFNIKKEALRWHDILCCQTETK